MRVRSPVHACLCAQETANNVELSAMAWVRSMTRDMKQVPSAVDPSTSAAAIGLPRTRLVDAACLVQDPRWAELGAVMNKFGAGIDLSG